MASSPKCELKWMSRACSEMKKRPRHLDVCLHDNHVVYASHTLVGKEWVGGLFSNGDTNKGSVLCEYSGKKMTKEEENTSTSEYLMVARNPQDLRRRIVIDGDPRKYLNIAGYANYSDHQHANAYFVDETCKGGKCTILLKAGEFIPAGTEIRVDYDMGSAVHPFRDMMVKKGIYSDCKQEYKNILWDFPLH
mgnify:FL=1